MPAIRNFSIVLCIVCLILSITLASGSDHAVFFPGTFPSASEPGLRTSLQGLMLSAFLLTALYIGYGDLRLAMEGGHLILGVLGWLALCYDKHCPSHAAVT
ncbi:Os11g0527500 [Oryza sativa Japonica Group]|uniref:Os11g0527500 protein n=1 Tax=Oryza sativa subsp. japonica TaxID=39947 RepID=A0A0P0Y2N1_ORYSJ|nr:hypothetical protein EE612_055870 [Oryza sativa]BAT14255.1 Os11g0527500 [Oryza sativa Japonica Group]